VTYSQLSKFGRIRKYHKKRVPVLHGNPQQKAICIRTRIMKPKKPNSAQRKVARVRLIAINKQITTYIPGQGHSLQQYAAVLIRGGRVRDLPGIRSRVIRGVLDALPVLNRKQRRSKYGVAKKNR
jgi:small subunit ribosomal protein S12